MKKIVSIVVMGVVGICQAGLAREYCVSPEGIGQESDLQSVLGGEIKSMTTEQEQSAVGIGEITRVLIINAPQGSKLYKAGLREGDLITKLNGKRVRNLQEFLAMCKNEQGRTVVIEIHDNSQEKRITLNIPQAR